MENIWIFSPASSANLNVGFDCLGWALEGKGEYIKLEKRGDKSIKIESCIPDNIPLEAEKNIGGIVAAYICDKYDLDQGVNLYFYKEILPGSGLGSSASSAAGVAYGMNDLFQLELSDEELFDAALQGESFASGSKHGDNLCPALFGGCEIISSIEPLKYIKLDVRKYKLLIAYPFFELNTKESRGSIPNQIQTEILNKTVQKMGSFIQSIANHDEQGIKNALNECWIEVFRKESIPHFDQLRESALDNGALGFGISGSGPAVFAFLDDEFDTQKIQVLWGDIYKSSGLKSSIFESKCNELGTIKLKEHEVPKHVRERICGRV